MQSSPTLRVLPAICLALAAVSTQAPAPQSQSRFRVTTDGEWFLQEANGRRLARLARGAVVTGGETQGEWMRVVIEGWIWGRSVGPSPRAGFDLAVTRTPEENLRSSAGGALVAKLAEGFLLTKISESGSWMRVQRSGWVRRAGLEEVSGMTAAAAEGAEGGDSASPTPGRRPGVSPPDTNPSGISRPGSATSTGDPSRVQPARATQLYRAPEGPEAGSLSPETPLRVLGRTGEWTRVQVEGWVKNADLEIAPPGVLLGVSAAELRAEPERYQGKVMQWVVQYVATQLADDLRPDIPEGTTYILARGPVPERGFVYVIVPENRKAQIETLTPLVELRITARVRAARSRFLGNPVVDLITLEVLP